MTVKYFDIHSHLNFDQFDEDRLEVIENMRKEGIAPICVGTDEKTSRECVELARQHSDVILGATAGVHPTDLPDDLNFEWLKELLKAQSHEDAQKYIVGIGECGLDYYRDQSQKDAQKKLFEKQIEIAAEYDLPLMLHGRSSEGTMDAYEDILDILFHYSRESANKLRGNFHFFVGDIDIAKKVLELGFSVSFDGPITFSRDYDDVIRFVPLESAMVETDAPFAAPEPYRGKRNSPLYVPEIVRAVARIRGEDEHTIRLQTVQNALTFFSIKA